MQGFEADCGPLRAADQERRGGDSNPRYLAVRWFSRPVHSATLPPLQVRFLQGLVTLRNLRKVEMTPAATLIWMKATWSLFEEVCEALQRISCVPSRLVNGQKDEESCTTLGFGWPRFTLQKETSGDRDAGTWQDWNVDSNRKLAWLTLFPEVEDCHSDHHDSIFEPKLVHNRQED